MSAPSFPPSSQHSQHPPPQGHFNSSSSSKSSSPRTNRFLITIAEVFDYNSPSFALHYNFNEEHAQLVVMVQMIKHFPIQ
jgi:hypothetical protein